MTDWPPLHDYSRSRAVVMGTSEYEFLIPVPAVANSMRRMTGMLTGGLCGWPRERLLVIENERDPGNLPDRLITAFEDTSDVAMFYYVGHGQIDADDQLCLGLVRSRPDPRRRASTSLKFADVRQALLDSGAGTKIVILDCCFAGLASRPVSTLAGLTGDVLDTAAGAGAYTMAATSAYTSAWYEEGPGVAEPETFFTKYLVDLVENGIPGQPARLRLDMLYQHLRDWLAADGRPLPRSRAIDSARDFVFAHNAVPRECLGEPEPEVVRLSRRLAEAEASQAAADVRIRALRVEAANRAAELERLEEQARHPRSMTGQQRRRLRGAIDAAGRDLDEIRAAETAAEDAYPGDTAGFPASAMAAGSSTTAHARPPGAQRRSRRLLPATARWWISAVAALITAAAAFAIFRPASALPPSHPAAAGPSASTPFLLCDQSGRGACAATNPGSGLSVTMTNPGTYEWVERTVGHVSESAGWPFKRGSWLNYKYKGHKIIQLESAKDHLCITDKGNGNAVAMESCKNGTQDGGIFPDYFIVSGLWIVSVTATVQNGGYATRNGEPSLLTAENNIVRDETAVPEPHTIAGQYWQCNSHYC